MPRVGLWMLTGGGGMEVYNYFDWFYFIVGSAFSP